MSGESMERTAFMNELSIDHEALESVSLQIVDSFRRHIIRSRTRPGVELPSERKVASHLGIHRKTVHVAYETLMTEGLLERLPGRRGAFVASGALDRYKPKFPAIGIVMRHGLSGFIKETNPNTLEYLSQAIDRATELDHSTMVVTLSPPEEESSIIQARLDHFIERVTGFIHFGDRGFYPDQPLETLIADRRTPHVFVSGHSSQADVSSVCDDVRGAADAAARHLLEFGHRDVGIIRSDWNVGVPRVFLHNANDRADRFLRSFKSVGLTVRDEWIGRRCERKEQLRVEIERICSLPRRPTALWCQNDDMAFAVLDILKERGIRVPEDVSLIGYDDVERDRGGKSFLTSIHQPRRLVAERAVDLVVELGRGGLPAKEKHIRVPAELVIRKSTGPASEEPSSA